MPDVSTSTLDLNGLTVPLRRDCQNIVIAVTQLYVLIRNSLQIWLYRQIEGTNVGRVCHANLNQRKAVVTIS